MTQTNWQQLNGLALAYIGDAVYDLFIRTYILEKGLTQPNQLHKESIRYVSAKAQATIIQQLVERKLLTQEEHDYFRRGRNAKSHTIAKNADVVTYRMATGCEALFGYLHLSQQVERLQELFKKSVQIIEELANEKRK